MIQIGRENEEQKSAKSAAEGRRKKRRKAWKPELLRSERPNTATGRRQHNMGEVIGDMLGIGDDPLMEEPAKLYVLSTESLQFGAAALFYPGVIEKIGKRIPEGFYVLPSSMFYRTGFAEIHRWS